jgi:transcriptional regulator PpsR
LTRRAHQQPADLSVLSDCAAEVAEAFVSLASDIALVIDEQGTVTRVAHNAAAPLAADTEGWVGRPWAETVTGDTRRKIELMLADLEVTGVARRREVNLAGEGGDIPIAFTALRLGRAGPVIAVGRDLRAVAAIQQRFLDVQQEMERSYWRARQLESRYRLLFQVATDAVMTVEAHSLRIIEANHAAVGLFGSGAGHGAPLAGQVATRLFDASSRTAVQGLLDSARASGLPAEIIARLLAGAPGAAGLGGANAVAVAVAVSAAPFRASDGMRLLLRVRAQDTTAPTGNELSLALARLVDTTQDGVVVTDSGGHIQVANPAFVSMVGASSEDAVRGRPIGEWVGRVADDVPSLIAGVHGHGIAQLVRTSFRRAAGVVDADVSAALLTEGDQECFGFTVRLRPESARPTAQDTRRAGLLQGLAAIEAELGRTPAAGLLAQGRRLLDQHLALVALERTGGDTARAAALLGLPEGELQQLRSEAAAFQAPGATAAPG